MIDEAIADAKRCVFGWAMWELRNDVFEIGVLSQRIKKHWMETAEDIATEVLNETSRETIIVFIDGDKEAHMAAVKDVKMRTKQKLKDMMEETCHKN